MSQTLDRLYELLPAVYRLRDAAEGYPLRALLQVIAEQVNVVEADIARLYENWFIETCDDWVVPYLGDLVGYRAVTPTAGRSDGSSPLDKVLTPRRDVADTIANRRRKGALALLEELAADVAGLPTRVVEGYKLLGWTQHVKYPRPQRGRTANLRDGKALADINTAFDNVARTVDVRRVASNRLQGRHNIPNVAAFVWRLRSYSVTYATAECLDAFGAFAYTFSPLGHNLQLYNRPQPEAAATQIAEAVNLPLAIRRRAFEERSPGKKHAQAAAAYYGADDNRLGRSLAIWVHDWPQKGAPQSFTEPVPREKIIPADLSDWSYRPPRDHLAVDPQLGRIAFPKGQSPAKSGECVRVSYHYGFSAEMGGGEYPRALSQHEPSVLYRVSRQQHEKGRDSGEERSSTDGASDEASGAPEKIFASLLDALKQWEEDKQREQEKPASDPTKDVERFRAAVLEILDSATYREEERLRIHLRAGESLQIRAAQGRRPVLKILDYSAGLDALFISGRRGSRFALDGLVVSGRGIQIGRDEEENGEPNDGYAKDGGKDREREANDYAGTDERQNRYQDRKNDNDDDKGDADNDGEKGDDKGDLDNDSGYEADDLCSVTIRHCTLAPGWELEYDCEPKNDEPSLYLSDTAAAVTIERSIIGAIRIETSGREREPVRLQITDSIVDATSSDSPAIAASAEAAIAHARLTVARSTVLGGVYAHAIEAADNSIFDGRVFVARRQPGCMRFCYVAPGSRTPRRYACQPDLALAKLRAEKGRRTLFEIRAEATVNQLTVAALTTEEQASEERRVRPQFVSRRYGFAAYCQLAATCAAEITEGAEDESEMGVFHDLYLRQRLANLRARLDEYTPAGSESGVIITS